MIEVDYDVEKIDWLRSVPFVLVHLIVVVGVFLVPPTWPLVGLALFFYVLRMWGIVAGYHRYFSHRSFKTSRAFQLVLAVVGLASAQKGPLWWAAHHRHHHRHSDEEPDLHSPTLKGFVWAHVGWFLSHKYQDTEHHKIRDFMGYPELRWLDRHYLAVPLAFASLLWICFGFEAFFWGGLVSTVALWHGTFTINSLAHVIGRRRFKTTDTSRNNFWLAMITLGEGWHNNHHYYPGSARQGFYWWEIDLAYYSLKFLELFGIVWDVRGVPQHVLEKGRRLEEAAAAEAAAAGG